MEKDDFWAFLSHYSIDFTHMQPLTSGARTAFFKWSSLASMHGIAIRRVYGAHCKNKLWQLIATLLRQVLWCMQNINFLISFGSSDSKVCRTIGLLRSRALHKLSAVYETGDYIHTSLQSYAQNKFASHILDVQNILRLSKTRNRFGLDCFFLFAWNWLVILH